MPNHELTKRFGVNLRERMRDVGSERLPHEMFELLAKLSQGEPQPLKAPSEHVSRDISAQRLANRTKTA
jgi:hypothetical protein